jgi:glycerol-1-phosphate dehydrogenase [NAD(P)+]
MQEPMHRTTHHVAATAMTTGERASEEATVSTERIRAALPNATDTKDVMIGAGVLSSVDDVFGRSFGDRPAVVVADENTFKVAGEQVHQQFETTGRTLADPYIFPGQPTLRADYGNITTLVEHLRGHDAIPVAVGSGTLNDIVKRATHECDRPYLAVATAASVDGYTSFGASITKDGFKQTLTCPAPRAVLADLDVLTAAPAIMTAAGYGDLLGKIPAGADWIVADTLEVDPIDPYVWSLVQGPLREVTARPAELAARDRGAMVALVEGLMMSGLAMQVAGSSRPASGAEHYFSHLWELEGLAHGVEGGPPPEHGLKVGFASIAMAAFYERILRRDLGEVDIDARRAAWPSWAEVEREVRATHQTPGLDQAALAQSREKYIDADQLAQRLTLLRERWPALRERIQQQLLPADRLREQLGAAGCPTSPVQLGLSLADLKATYVRAPMIRSRYTVLDLAYETGTLDECVDELFAPGGYWAQDPVGRT